MIFGLHHRQKKHKFKLASNSWLAALLDKVGYLAGVMMALMTAPQIYKIYSEQTAVGVSQFTWTMYAIGSCFWVVYGIAHREKPIIFCNVIAAILQFAVVVGTLAYQ